jgi:8-oxo-dGTP diphosphatase
MHEDDRSNGPGMSSEEQPVAESGAPAHVGRKAIGAAALIFDEQKRALLVRRNYSRHAWVLPGGAVEAGESVVDAVVREVLEETGLVVEPERVTGIYHEPQHPAGDFLHFAFLCRRLDSTVDPRIPPDELSDWGFFGPADLPRPISELTVRRISDAVSGGIVLPVTVPRSRLVP